MFVVPAIPRPRLNDVRHAKNIQMTEKTFKTNCLLGVPLRPKAPGGVYAGGVYRVSNHTRSTQRRANRRPTHRSAACSRARRCAGVPMSRRLI